MFEWALPPNTCSASVGFTPRAPYFGGKVVGLLALGGAGAANVINALHHTTRAMNGLTAPTTAIIGESALDPDRGTLRDENAERRLRQLATEIIALAHRLQNAPVLR